MLGNAAEWTTSEMRDYPSLGMNSKSSSREEPSKPGKPSLDREWLGHDLGELDYIVARGGSFHLPAEQIRPAGRFFVHPSFVGPEIGFRVARTLAE